ncbi:DUF3050 domain-containing protein [Effusibacillus pohliae]|uniref:DUF3050 domain-containing protein n=1 Tax=Effusibacillus pohliae TaxID=232270 RepID=UPI00037737A2|nr:DUF3050 domain-containing protein [Effusibacillus pohliae]
MTTVHLQKVEAKRHELLKHPVYRQVNSLQRIRIFMEHHVFAVWDFMCLLKRLQQQLTCVDVAWVPGKEPRFARLVNEIVLGEESDEDGRGGYASHFQLYCEAMAECGADLTAIERFIVSLQSGTDPFEAVHQAKIPQTVREFVAHNLQIAFRAAPHEVAAAFFFGREDIIPDMFQKLVPMLEQHGLPTERFVYYLKRHIELDGDQHGPLAEQLLVYLCGNDSKRWAEAERVAIRSLAMRIRLWDGVLAAFSKTAAVSEP